MHLEGKIELDSVWKPVLYFSLIDQFNHLEAASYHFLVAEIPLDDEGRFSIQIDGLPKEDHLYRLHICKFGDPVSTIMIGGRDQNFIHFIANAQSQLHFSNEQDNSPFYKTIVTGHQANVALANLLNLKRKSNTAPGLSTAQNRVRLKNKTKEHYVQMIDTSSFGLVRLLAIYFLDELEATQDLNIYRREMKNLQAGDTSPYAKQFIERYHYLAFQEKSGDQKAVSWISGLVSVLFIALFSILVFVYRNNRKKKVDVSTLAEKPFDIDALSSQERRVLELLQIRKSNKEIASTLNIEVTTVKSHIYRIYNKLGIKSRKDVWV